MSRVNVGFKPLFNRVLIERASAVKKVGSIIIPETIQSKNQPTEGTVICAGDTCDEKVKNLIGKKVIFARFSGDMIKIGNDEFFICTDEDILGVCDE